MPIHEYPTFQKTYIKLLAFTKDLHYYLFPLTERNSKITFDFKKKGESDNSVQYVFSRSCDTLSTESGPTHIRPWEPHSASQVQAAPALNYACEHLCFVFIDSMHLLAMQDFQMCGVCVCVCVYKPGFMVLQHWRMKTRAREVKFTTEDSWLEQKLTALKMRGGLTGVSPS